MTEFEEVEITIKAMRPKQITFEEFEELRRAGKIEAHHTAYARGYVSRKTDGYITKYDGRFGKGYIWHMPTWESTQYHNITYYIFT